MQTYLANVVRHRALIRKLAFRDFQARHSGSLLGFLWAFVQPLLTILMYLFIYSVGLRPVALGKVPFVLWLITGVVPWFYFADGLVTATNSLIEYSYLVKKVVFEVTLIPAIKLASAAMTHGVVLVAVMLIVAVAGFPPRLSWLQVPYYAFATISFVSGLALATSGLTVFVRDLYQAVGVGMQFLFWLTPVAWTMSNAPPRFVPLLKLNPLHYLVDGMRDSLLLGRWFWQKPFLSLYFWAITIALNLIGYALFRRLRPHFSDVL
jgi:ABC-type polysaccharide/polyol phosphate export permease